MPDFDIIKQSNYKPTFRNESIKGQFDLKIDNVVERFTGNIDIENREWNVGLIVGSSGSGKTTIARQVFGDNYCQQHKFGNESIIDEMPKGVSTTEITKVFNSVGFATVWSWLKPYHVLSNGEKMRVDLAREILANNELIVFDEFTSVVDRTVAKTASYAVQRAVRKQGKQFVAIACHYDVIDWLEPDWIYDTDKGEFFFALANSDDPNSRLKFDAVKHRSGDFLKGITI